MTLRKIQQQSLLLAFAALTFMTPRAHAQPLIDGSTVTLNLQPTQTFVIPAGTPGFNPGDQPLIRTVTGVGASTFTVDLSGSTLQLVNGSFFGVGFDEVLGPFELFTGPDNGFDPMTITFENVVGDPSTGDFTADVLEFTVANYGAILLAAGVELEVRDSFFFTGGTFNGLPPTPAVTTFADPFDGTASELEVFIRGTDTVVGISTERLVAIIPEPNACVLAALLAAGLVTLSRRG